VGRDSVVGELVGNGIVSIHAPRVGRDYVEPEPVPPDMFQFTRPAWGATAAFTPPFWSCGRFNSRAPRGARQKGARSKQIKKVSIHAPRVGRDGMPATEPSGFGMFQFTRPAWGATRQRLAIPA